MIYKLQNGGIIKLQNAWTTIPKSEDVILRSWERQRQKEMQSTSTGRASGMYNTNLPLQTEYPEAVVFGGSLEAIKTAQQKGTLTFPWDQRGRGIVENELLAPDGTINFIDFVPRDASTSYFDLNGSLNKYLGYKSFGDVYRFGDYNRFTDIPVEKPKFKQGGKI